MIFGMGLFRFSLAFFVVISHLWADMFGGPAAYAVWGFFVLSGFLMTEILRNKYGFTVQGLQKYTFNRFVRIFPLYYVALIAGIITILAAPAYNANLTALNPQFLLPESIYSWIVNVVLLPFDSIAGRPVPVSGALAVEVGVYILIPFMAFNRSAAWLGATLSLLVSIKYGIDLETFAPRYSEFLTGYFAFAIGSLANHYKTALTQISMPKISILIWLGHCLVIGVVNTWPWTYGLYISTFLSAWVVISLYKIESTKIDTFLGDLSYPVYLFHTTVGAWMLFYFDASRSFAFFLVSFVLTILFSWILLILVDHPIQKMKKKASLISNNQITVDEYLIRLIKRFKNLFTYRHSKKIIFSILLLIGLSFTIFLYKIYFNNDLKIYAWGPQETLAGVVPNVQPGGDAGIWIKTDLTLGLGKLEILVDGKPTKTEVASNLITATIPKQLFEKNAAINIKIIQVKTGNIITVGILRINKKVDDVKN